MELEQLYREIYPKLVAYFYANTSSREAAEDLAQDVFYAALRGARSFAGRSSVATWLFGMARNKLNRYYRSKRYKARLADKLANSAAPVRETGPEEEVVRNELQRRLLDAIRRLEEPQRDIVLLRLYGELSFREIGELAGISEQHARVIFYRAKLKLLKELGEA